MARISGHIAIINEKGVVKMNIEYLRKQWEAEEQMAHIKGWDFSHLEGRYEEEQDLPWNV